MGAGCGAQLWVHRGERAQGGCRLSGLRGSWRLLWRQVRAFQVGGGVSRDSGGDRNRDRRLSSSHPCAPCLCRNVRCDLCRLLRRRGQLFALPHSCRLRFLLVLLRCLNRDCLPWRARELDSAPEPCHSERWMNRSLGSRFHTFHTYSSADGTSTLAARPQRLRVWCDRRTLPAENHS